jgi:hypothetical protein
MNCRERLTAAVNFEEYDRPPFADNEWNETLAEMVPRLAGCRPCPDRRYTEAERATAVRASMDMVPWSHVYDHPRYPVLGDIPASREGERIVDEDGFVWVIYGFTEWIEHRPFSDLSGFLSYLDRKAEQACRDAPALPSDFLERLRHAREMLEGTAIAMPYLGAGLDGLYRLAGWDIFAQAVTEQPAAIAEYLDAAADRTVRLVHLYAEHLTARDCPVALGAYSDIAYNNGLLLSPRFLRFALEPAVRKIVAAYHEHGIKVVYHSEGDMREFLDDLIDAGVDGINPLSPSENMDPVEIRRLYPGLILWGGIDERAVLVSGTPEDVKREVKRVVTGVGRGLVLGSSGGVHPACPAENCIAMIEALREMAAPQRAP